MRIVVIGAGALGASIGAKLAAAGEEVTLVDRWVEHVEAIRARGLRAAGVPHAVELRLPACLPDDLPAGQDLALVTVDTNHTAEAAAQAQRALGPEGFALTLQNGIGNIEQLVAVLGPSRVVGGSTMCSFRTIGPGAVEQTHLGPTMIGELDGTVSARMACVRDRLVTAGYPVEVSADIQGVIWQKFILNIAINPICAITGLRLGEVARLEATDRFQDRLLDEAFEVVHAKGLALPEAELRRKVKAHTRAKFSKPSMLQHMEAGRRTEIDALNGALVREAKALGLSVPFHEALTLLIKGRELFERRRVHEPGIDYAALEAAAQGETG